MSFVDGGSATLYEHCRFAIEKSFKRFSPRGLPLIGEHDWNDGMNAVGSDWKEKAFGGSIHVPSARAVPASFNEAGDGVFADRCRDVMQSLKDAVNEYAWDGEWFIRATKDDGGKIGSKENEEGKIFLNAQTWAVISDITDSERKAIAMDSAGRILLKDFGALLLYPAFTKPAPDTGYITRYAPG